MGKAATVKSESATSIAAVCLGSSTVPITVMIVVKYRLVYQLIGRSQAVKSCSGGSTVPVIVMIVVEYRLVYQLIGRLQAAKVYSGGSTVPAAIVIVVKYRACLSVGWLIVGVQARLFGRQITGVSARSVS